MMTGSSSTQPCCWVNGCQIERWSSAARGMRWTLGREPVGNREDAAGLGQRCRLRTREPDDRDLAEALDRLHVAALHRGWVPGPGRQHNCLYAQGNRARRLDSQEAV